MFHGKHFPSLFRPLRNGGKSNAFGTPTQRAPKGEGIVGQLTSLSTCSTICSSSKWLSASSFCRSNRS